MCPVKRRRAILASHDGYDNNVFMLILRKDFGAFLHRGTGGEDVIDQNDARRFLRIEGFSLAGELDRALEIFQSLPPRESRLRGRGANASECGDDRELEESPEVAGDFVRLIVKALLFASAVERHGNKRPALLQSRLQARIRKSLRGEAGEFTGEVEIFLILQTVNQLTRLVRAIEHWPREAERIA